MPAPVQFVSTKKLREELWTKDPHCHWCGRLTVQPSEILKMGQPNPPEMATIDHLVDRFEGRNRNNFNNVVLACNECNNRRGRERQAKIPLEELQRRSKLHQQAKLRRRKHNQTEWDEAIARYKEAEKEGVGEPEVANGV